MKTLSGLPVASADKPSANARPMSARNRRRAGRKARGRDAKIGAMVVPVDLSCPLCGATCEAGPPACRAGLWFVPCPSCRAGIGLHVGGAGP